MREQVKEPLGAGPDVGDQETGFTVTDLDADAAAVEAGSPQGWHEWADAVVAVDTFGASAPAAVVFQEYGFSAENVAGRARELMGR